MATNEAYRRPRWAAAFEKSPLRGNNRAANINNNNNVDDSGNKKRVVSLDSSNYSQQNSYSSKCGTNTMSSHNNAKRSFSANLPGNSNNKLIRRLKFESIPLCRIDSEHTPLSTKRSCSEFQRVKIDPKTTTKPSIINDSKKPSILSKLFFWRNGKSKNNDNNNTSNGNYESEISEDRLFAVNNLRSRDNNDSFYDNLDESSFLWSSVESTDRTISSASNPGNNSRNRTSTDMHSQSFSIQNPYSVSRDGGSFSTSFSSVPSSTQKKERSRSRVSILYETSIALDVLFGYKGGSAMRGEPMEIELQDMKHLNRNRNSNSSTNTTISNNMNLSGGITLTAGDYVNANLNPVGTNNNVGGNSNTMLSAINNNNNNSNSRNNEELNGITTITTIEHMQSNSGTFFACMKTTWNSFLSTFVQLGNKYVMSTNSEYLYEQLRVQPFSAGAYLRGLLVSGYSSFFLAIYSLSMIPSKSQILLSYSFQESMWTVINTFLVFLVVSNVIQIPFRLNLHRYCWESSKSADVQGSILILRDMLQGDYWAANLVVGRIVDIISVLFLIVSECYLYYSKSFLVGSVDPLRTFVVSISTTCALTFLIRVSVSLLFCISMHDPVILGDARKRGLSSCDIESLPTFVYSDHDEARCESQCTICLSPYSLGELLLPLPCDGKHCFHADCIRQWLERHNSCPLCQKMI